MTIRWGMGGVGFWFWLRYNHRLRFITDLNAYAFDLTPTERQETNCINGTYQGVLHRSRLYLKCPSLASMVTGSHFFVLHRI